MSAHQPRISSPTSFAQLKQGTRAHLSEGDTFGALDLLFQHEKHLSRDLADDILLARGSFIHSRDKYHRRLITGEAFDVIRNRMNYCLLAILDDLPEGPLSTGPPGGPERCREILSTSQELILVLYEGGQPYDLLFQTGWIGYRFFVSGKSKRRTKGPWKLNLLSYTKTFDFAIGPEEAPVDYRLRLRFSTMTGLLKHYLLIREKTIVLESKFPG